LIDGRKICQDVNKETVLAIVDRLDYSATTVAIANDVFAQRARMNR
jgi:hypothetical protein